MIIIKNWQGRIGNNMIQLIHSILFAQEKGHNIVQIPKHPLFKKREIILREVIGCEPKDQTDFFFSSRKMSFLKSIPMYRYREIAQTRILPILNFDIPKKRKIQNTVSVHLRGGDIFNKKPHPNYIIPPLSYYYNILKDFEQNKITIVYEDKRNICLQPLNDTFKEATYQSCKLINDIQLLCESETFVCGMGTFSTLIYFLSPNIKNIFLPDYFMYPGSSDFGEIKTHIIGLPNYIKPGKWKNTIEQREIILNYPNHQT